MTLYQDGKIILNHDNFVVPLWILDDVGDCYPQVFDNMLSEDDVHAVFNISFYESFVQLRKQIYWLCNWYDGLIDANIPVIKADIVPIDKLVLYQKCFLRCCNASPKDVSCCIFDQYDSIDNIIDVFKISKRTNYMFSDNNLSNHTHIVVRPIVTMHVEVRCVWHKYKLRAVSVPYFLDVHEQEQMGNAIILFFNTYSKDITFNSAVFDLNIINNIVTIIEINSFGMDMLAKIAYFDWKEDFNILYNSTSPVFRFKQIYEW